MQQSTIARRIVCSGTGLHSGEAVEIALCPGALGSGIVFVALGAGQGGRDVEIPARADCVLSSVRATTLAASDGAGMLVATNPRLIRIATVEHLLATLLALDLDNVRIEVKGAEIPVMDGSALAFVDWIRLAGRKLQPAPRRELRIVDPIEIRDGDRWIRIEPAEGLRISYAIDFAHPRIGRQSFEIPKLDQQVFQRELAAARTFGFTHELAALREAGLGLGGSLKNTIVLGDQEILNQTGLHWPDEFVRHKIVDLLGDLALLGCGLHAHVQVEKGGHRLHHRLVRRLFDLAEWERYATKSSSSRARAAVADGSLN